MMYSRLMPPLVILSLVDVGRPFATDMPPVVSVFKPFMTLQPLLGTGAVPPPVPPPPPLPPLVPPLPPGDAPPPLAFPPAAVPPEELPPLAVPPLVVPPFAAPPLVVPPLPAPPLVVPPLALPPVAEPPVEEPPLGLPPVPTADPPLPAGLEVSGVELPQPRIPIDNPRNSVGSVLCMRSFCRNWAHPNIPGADCAGCREKGV